MQLILSEGCATIHKLSFVSVFVFLTFLLFEGMLMMDGRQGPFFWFEPVSNDLMQGWF